MAATITVGRAGTLGEAVFSDVDLKAGRVSVKGTIVDLG